MVNPRNPIRAGATLQAIVPTSLDEVARFANMAVMAGLVIAPKKRRDDDSTPNPDQLVAMATAIILQGLDVGLHPMQSLQTISLINGRPLIWGDAVPALLWRAGFKISERVDGDGEKAVAVCTVTRPDGTVIERSFSVSDAKKAKLWDTREKVERWGKTFENDSPWFRFPMRMLAMRARGFAVKDGASDVTRGLYLHEEYEANDIVAIEHEQPKRKSSASAKRDGTEMAFNELRGAISGADTIADLQRITSDNASLMEVLPIAWWKIVEEEINYRMKDLRELEASPA